ncbi:S-layer homology domain-containing protein [Paenibacillus chondroitinus]|uniref:S-layer homology domain-containing protein n=1 Tax=Paenibacillus chondroitinus TaxID=59842 RepID=A0ABU6DGN8_9BACL|nr:MULTISPECIES: S-layer homology domain-containing protein [Paenibacillus]MCY9659529.1 S-layer homology domain-containing protein [Paenibacillus anseongense]MEB4796924.1 S-layer homology domain-containing protein [Paenibacillus chondroitinus]
MHPIQRMSLLSTLVLTLALPTLSVSAAAADDSALITRGQFIKQITDELKLTPLNKMTVLPTDVSPDSPYADTVRIMRERQILQGYSDGTFRLDQAVSPAEASLILGRFLGLADSKASTVLKSDYSVDFSGQTAGIPLGTAGAAIKNALANDPSVSSWLVADPTSPTDLKTFRGHMEMGMHILFHPNAGYPLKNLQTTVKSDISYNKAQGLHQSITTAAPGPDMAMKTINMEQYMVSQGTFMSMPNATNDGVEWYDMSKQVPFTFEQVMELQKKSMDVSKTLVTPYFFYKDLGTAEKDGQKQRKVSIRGKLTNTADIVKTLSGLGGSQDAFKEVLNSPAIAGMSVSISAVLTLDEQTKLPVSMDGDYIVEYGEDPNNPIEEMDMTMSMTYQDVNQPIDIQLPEEAKKAKPIPAPTTVPTPAE